MSIWLWALGAVGTLIYLFVIGVLLESAPKWPEARSERARLAVTIAFWPAFLLFFVANDLVAEFKRKRRRRRYLKGTLSWEDYNGRP